MANEKIIGTCQCLGSVPQMLLSMRPKSMNFDDPGLLQKAQGSVDGRLQNEEKTVDDCLSRPRHLDVKFTNGLTTGCCNMIKSECYPHL